MKPASGFRDFISDRARLRLELNARISAIYTRYGFEPVESPALENLDVLLGSGGEENEKLIFKTLKRGEKLQASLQAGKNEETDLADLGLRFDMTVPLCRLTAAHFSDLQMPWKVFHMGSVWRAERPQKGRYREFTQCDVDIIGSSSLFAETEILCAVADCFTEFGVNGLELRLSHRQFLVDLAASCGLSDKLPDFCILIDKMDKLPAEKMQAEFEQLCSGNLPEILQRLLKKQIQIKDVEKISPEAFRDLSVLMDNLKSHQISIGRVVFDSSLARGMGYYTGCIFEFSHPEFGFSLAGGGRYDQLVGRFMKNPVPAVGCSIGFERLFLYLEDQVSKKSSWRNEVFAVVFSDNDRKDISSLAKELRSLGIAVDVYADSAKPAKQFKYAAAKFYRWALIVGEQERANQKIKLKNLELGEELEFSSNQVAQIVQKISSFAA